MCLCLVASTTAFTCTTTYVPIVTSSQPSATPVTRGGWFPALMLEQDNITVSVECWTTAYPAVVFHLKLINSSSEDVLLGIQQMYIIDQRGRRFSPAEYREMSMTELPVSYPPLAAERLIPRSSQTGIISVRFNPRWRIAQATLHFNLVKQSSGQRIPFEATFRRR